MSASSHDLLPLFQTLVEIVAKLRGPGGCPWDLEQTARSLTQYAIEEAHELVEAIESGQVELVQEELGDFLFQVILQAQVAQDEGQFNLSDVISRLNQKMIRRHPHVFGAVELKDTEEVWKNWEKLKSQEKLGSSTPQALFSYPRSLPSLQAASKIGRKTQTWKFDWQTPEQVLEKVREELNETTEALHEFRKAFPNSDLKPQSPGREDLEHEIGDLLFSTAQLARHLGLDPEACLRQANRRFETRFQKVISRSGLQKEEFAALPDATKEDLWQQIKREE